MQRTLETADRLGKISAQLSGALQHFQPTCDLKVVHQYHNKPQLACGASNGYMHLQCALQSGLLEPEVIWDACDSHANV
eukprot:6476425-Amphidinium_carterae.3